MIPPWTKVTHVTVHAVDRKISEALYILVGRAGKTATDRNLKDVCVAVWTHESMNNVQSKGVSGYIMICKDGTKIKNFRPAGEFVSSYRIEMMTNRETLNKLEELKDAYIKNIL